MTWALRAARWVIDTFRGPCSDLAGLGACVGVGGVLAWTFGVEWLNAAMRIGLTAVAVSLAPLVVCASLLGIHEIIVRWRESGRGL